MTQSELLKDANFQERGIVIFDGECGFCRRWIRRMNSWFHKHPLSQAWQESNLVELGLSEAQCREAVQYVHSDLRVSSGSDAVAHVLLVAGFPLNCVGVFMLIPGIRSLFQVAYKWVANHRHLFNVGQ